MLVDALLQHKVDGQVNKMVENVRGLEIKLEVAEIAKEVVEVAKEVAEVAKEVVEMAKKVSRVVKEVVEVTERMEVDGQVNKMVENVRGLEIKLEVAEIAKEVVEVAKEVAEVAKEVVEMAKKVSRVVKEVVEVTERMERNNRNQDDNVINDNNQGNVRTMNEDRGGCSNNEFMACNPKDYDGKGIVVMAQPTSRTYAYRGHHKKYAPLTRSKPQKHMVPTAVLTQSKPVSNTAVRPAPVVSVVQGKQETWGNPQLALQDNGVIDSGCSRHMTGNMSYLSDFEELNGGYVAFGGNPKGGKITGKCKIKTGKLDFDDVYFVKELKFNLFSVSQMYDKKNSSRFTWVFFLATKDETTPILKTFLTGLENQLSLRVKVIKSDNGTEFKNYDINQLCGLKGIKREFSVPRTPRQNGIAKRKNRTLIEASRTMLADSLLPILFWAEDNPQLALQDKGVIDSGFSRHMTGNMSYLSDFEELNRGYVAFGGNPKGGKITSKGKIRTGKLEFNNVYFVKELKFNLFSVSQICDKKNSVLFTDTECLVLSFDFKLPDESQVLLRVPRENNMYNVNLKNIVPSRDLTCLFAEATLNESNLWHRRLAHVNFKTINKLVKGNLVRGLPTKVFENDHTCVACKKGKQHRASFDSLWCFSWPLLILKTFLAGLENQLSLKVKVIRSDNGTEFKNSDLNQFCGLKGIKREFSVPRTPQQNGIAERKNKTLIEATRTMTMNYQPVHAGNQTNSGVGFQDNLDAKKTGEEVDQSYMLFPVWSSVGFQDNFDAEKAGEEVDQSYMLFLVWSVGSINPQNNAEDAAFDWKEHDFDVKKPESKVILSPSNKFEDYSKNSRNEDNAAGSIVPTVGQNYLNITNTFSAAEPSISIAGPSNTVRTLPDDPDMPALEDITYSDDEDVVDAKADVNNLESFIPVSPIPTTRIHKDHPVSQIIGDPSLTTQTRSMTRAVKDQEEPKRIHQALKDPSWIKTMQEELLQFKMQKVWVLVDLPYGKRAIVKALYCLHQAPRAWYETLATYLLENGFHRDDIIFGETNKDLCRSFEKLMKDKFQMSSMGELTFFLGLQ
nr:hypothetical protein [Tanacetum cinerariifolium]